MYYRRMADQHTQWDPWLPNEPSCQWLEWARGSQESILVVDGLVAPIVQGLEPSDWPQLRPAERSD